MEHITKIKVALADDHVLLRSALAALINTFDDCQVIIEAPTGTDLLQKINAGLRPDIILLDLNMPSMDGFETSKLIQTNYPDIHVLMLTMYDTELTMIRLLQSGVKGFLKKDISPSELKYALKTVLQ